MASANFTSSDSASENEYVCGGQSTAKCLDLSYSELDLAGVQQNLCSILGLETEDFGEEEDHKMDNLPYNNQLETIFLYHNQLSRFPSLVTRFVGLKTLDISANNIHILPNFLLSLKHLSCLRIKNNHLKDDSLPKDFGKLQELKEINFSGNSFTTLPEQLFEIVSLKYLYMGGNQLESISGNIKNLKRLQVLYLGGNQLCHLPAEIGCLASLRSLIVCDNQLESLPCSIVNMSNLRSLLLHNNQLTILPPEIATIRTLTELSLRGNPLVVRFIRDMTYDPPRLLELAGRVIKSQNVPHHPDDLPQCLQDYLSSARHCVNPQCGGVYFDYCVSYVKFVDFCGKYKIPLMQYLCSERCTSERDIHNVPDDSDVRMKKVLLG